MSSDAGLDVGLRDVEEADLEVFFEYEHDQEAVQRSKFPPRDRERFMEHWRTKILGNASGFVQTVTVDGAPAGHIVAWWDEDRRFVGYWLGRDYWGRGVGTKALTAFVAREEARPLHADPHIGNTASVRLLERIGFRRQETIWHDEYEHLLLVLH
jgi:RimJ/RimL family protein N-acetyltransferase